MHLLDKLRSQLLHGNVDKILEGILIRKRSDHRDTVAIGEEAFEQAPNPIFLVNRLGESLLLAKCLLEVLLGVDGVTFLVNQLQCEVAHNPHKRWKVLRKILRVDFFIIDTGTFYLDVLGQVDNEIQILKGVLVNRTDRVVNEVGR